jgi:hypothetical protein
MTDLRPPKGPVRVVGPLFRPNRAEPADQKSFAPSVAVVGITTASSRPRSSASAPRSRSSGSTRGISTSTVSEPRIRWLKSVKSGALTGRGGGPDASRLHYLQSAFSTRRESL